jgi:hypothetical protein
MDAGSGAAVVVVLGVGVASVVGADVGGALVAAVVRFAMVGLPASPPPPVQAPTASRAVSEMPM